jgi:thioredoxin-related protein
VVEIIKNRIKEYEIYINAYKERKDELETVLQEINNQKYTQTYNIKYLNTKTCITCEYLDKDIKQHPCVDCNYGDSTKIMCYYKENTND